jgi:dipeptidyl aminopeptidase/acylaminoacyl peptidase
LARVSAAGGKAEILTTPDPKKGEMSHRFPHILPGGDAVLFGIMGKAPGDVKVGVLSLKTRVRQVLVEGGAAPHYVAGGSRGTGYLVYWRAGSLFAVHFNSQRLEVTGSAVPVLEGVAGMTGPGAGGAAFSFSDAGTLVFIPGAAGAIPTSKLVWVDRQGKEQPDTGAQAPPQPYRNVRLSPDGKLAAMSVGDRTQNHIAVYDTARGTLTRVSFQGNADYPVWTPDGKRVTFGVTDGDKNGISWVPADGSSPPAQLVSTDRLPVLGSWSPDGKILAFHYLAQPIDIWLFSPGPAAGGHPPGAAPQLYQQTPFDKFAAQFSPDGRWLAYAASAERGGVFMGLRGVSSQVYVQPAPSVAPAVQPGAKWQISVDGGTGPRWSRDGRELFFRNGDKVMSAAIEPAPTFRAGTPRMLFEGRFDTTFPSGGSYDVTPDGKRFLMIRSAERDGGSAQMQFVVEWFEEVRRRVQAGAAAP